MSFVTWLALLLLAPFVLLVPGYLVLRLLARPDGAAALWGEDVTERVGLAVVVSLAILLLLAFGLSQTVGLSRWSLVAALTGLLGAMGLLARSRLGTARRGQAGPERSDAANQPLTPWPGGLDLDVSFSTASVVLIGATMAIVATGALLYDGSEPYSEVAYANASGVPSSMAVDPGQQLTWTVVVENHEERTATYTLETVLVPNATAGEPDTPQVPADETRLELAHGATATREVTFQAPEDGTWKVQTLVHVEDREEPLRLHRWIAVR